jgi:hypothetical protein
MNNSDIIIIDTISDIIIVNRPVPNYINKKNDPPVGNGFDDDWAF